MDRVGPRIESIALRNYVARVFATALASASFLISAAVVCFPASPLLPLEEVRPGLVVVDVAGIDVASHLALIETHLRAGRPKDDGLKLALVILASKDIKREKEKLPCKVPAALEQAVENLPTASIARSAHGVMRHIDAFGVSRPRAYRLANLLEAAEGQRSLECSALGALLPLTHAQAACR